MHPIPAALRSGVPLVLTALTIASCSSSSEEMAKHQTPEPSTEVVTVLTTTQATQSASESASDRPAPAPLTSPSNSSGAPTAPVPAPDTSGAQANFNGQEVTMCSNGDGWGISELAVNANTSCPFAFNVLNSLTAGVPSTENIRAYLPRTVTATSPTTGQSYEMYCEDNGVGIIVCTGGNNAEVIAQ